ncbi:MAG: chemotaxis protein CheW [Myxococcota bacterium]
MARRQRRTANDRSLVGFTVDELAYGLPIDAVREIIRPLPLVDVPHAPDAVVGVADHRNAVVPIVDLRLFFGREPSPPTRRTKWIIVGRGAQGDVSVGLVVDAVTEVFGVSEKTVRSVPEWAEAQLEAGMGEVVSRRGELVFVLLPDIVMAPGLRTGAA